MILMSAVFRKTAKSSIFSIAVRSNMSTFFTSDSTFGISMWTIILSLLDCTTVTLFLIGCINYVKIGQLPRLKEVGACENELG